MIDAADYSFLASLLNERTGLAIGTGKEYLVESRLRPLAHSRGLPSVSDLVARIRAAPTDHLVRDVCEAMATHESSFFRDGTPFELLRTRILPELVEQRSRERTLRIWSAAASTGQEPYSVAMILDDFPIGDWTVEIVATDYSRVALDRARQGVYTTFEIQRGMTRDQQNRFCVRYGTNWRIRESTRSRVSFSELNLIHTFGHLGTFDLVLCRNVLIYFDVDTRREVLDRIAERLSPTGYLLLGAAESAIGVTERFVRLNDLPSSIYQKCGAVAIASR
jgi:chemotaxis protein methyltransferase CheR